MMRRSSESRQLEDSFNDDGDGFVGRTFCTGGTRPDENAGVLEEVSGDTDVGSTSDFGETADGVLC